MHIFSTFFCLHVHICTGEIIIITQWEFYGHIKHNTYHNLYVELSKDKWHETYNIKTFISTVSFTDKHVKSSPPNKIITHSAYVLLYQVHLMSQKVRFVTPQQDLAALTDCYSIACTDSHGYTCLWRCGFGLIYLICHHTNRASMFFNCSYYVEVVVYRTACKPY